MQRGKTEKINAPAMGSNRMGATRLFARAPDTRNAVSPTTHAIDKKASVIPIELCGSWPINVLNLTAVLNRKYQYVTVREEVWLSKLRKARLYIKLKVT